MGHNLVGRTHDQVEIRELVAVTVVVEQRRHEQSVVFQARVWVVDALVERASDIATEPCTVDGVRIIFCHFRRRMVPSTSARVNSVGSYLLSPVNSDSR